MRYVISLITLLFFLSCSKDDNDVRDKFAGKYIGIQIYTDFQLKIKDTSNVIVYLRKYDQDDISALELELPTTSQRYLYDVISDSLVFHEYFYHCPVLTFRNDTLFINWQPSMAPRVYEYVVVKGK